MFRGGGGGSSGSQGPAGPAGPGILTTSGAPSNAVGVDTQYANDPTAQVMYGPKASGVWPAGTSYKGLGWTYGVGAPNDADGMPDGTFYYDTTPKASGGNGYVYIKQSGTYGTPVVAQFGADGAPGSNAATFKGWNSGTGAPASTLGNVGEMYEDTTSVPYKVYGPKQSSSPPTPNAFWGVNLHINGNYSPWTVQTPSTYLTWMSDLNMQSFRTNCNSTTALTNSTAAINAMVDAGYTCMIVIDQGVSLSASYASNYSTFNTLCGNIAAQALATIHNPSAIIWEVTNERDYLCRIDIPPAQGGVGVAGTLNPIDGFGPDGSVRTDLVPSAVEALRGAVAGGYDAIRATIPTAKIGMATGIPYSWVCQEMFYKGWEVGYVSGAATKTPILFDFLCIHWYQSMNNIENAGPSNHRLGRTGGTGSYCPDAPPATPQPNVPAYLNSKMPGLPIYISEWGSLNTDANQASYMTTQGQLYFNKRTTYNIAGVMMYALFPNSTDAATPNYGLVQIDGVTKKAAYTTLKALGPTNITPGGAAWGSVVGVMPAPTDIPSVIGLTPGSSANIGRFSSGTTAYQLNWYESTDANGSFTNTSYGYLSFSGGFGQINTGATGTGSAKAIQLGLNGVSLYQVSASFYGPIVTGKNNGQAAIPWNKTFTTILNVAPQIVTASQTLNTSTPSVIICNAASAITLTMETTPDSGTVREIYNNTANLVTLSGTGLSGTIAQGVCKRIYYAGTLGTPTWIYLSTT